MARIKNEDTLKMVAIRLEESKLEKIDDFAKRLKLTRAHVVRSLIDSGLDDLELMQKTGLLAMAIKGRDLLDLVRSSLGEDRYSVKGNKLIIDL